MVILKSRVGRAREWYLLPFFMQKKEGTYDMSPLSPTIFSFAPKAVKGTWATFR